MYRRNYGAPRFYDYREITARFDSMGCDGTHPIRKGDRIGYVRRFRKTVCAACWTRWVEENREADALEAGYVSCPW